MGDIEEDVHEADGDDDDWDKEEVLCEYADGRVEEYDEAIQVA